MTSCFIISEWQLLTISKSFWKKKFMQPSAVLRGFKSLLVEHSWHIWSLHIWNDIHRQSWRHVARQRSICIAVSVRFKKLYPNNAFPFIAFTLYIAQTLPLLVNCSKTTATGTNLKNKKNDILSKGFLTETKPSLSSVYLWNIVVWLTPRFYLATRKAIFYFD